MTTPKPTHAAIDHRRLLRRRMARAGLTTAALARRAGMKHPAPLYDYLAGKSTITIDTYARLLRACATPTPPPPTPTRHGVPPHGPKTPTFPS
jgi:transcriptional regulator with XRE-family HTH domain